jgi:lysozyme
VTFDPRLLQQDLIRDEGLHLKPYRDTAGKLTIGVGRNLDDVGVTRDEALMLLANDIAALPGALDRALPWWRGLDEPRARSLANMAFNLGASRLLEFRRMLGALRAGDYETAAREAMNSKWAAQVGQRANRIAVLIGEG